MCLQSVVLENLSFGFLKSNILDVKLGTVLYKEASPDKVARTEKAAKVLIGWFPGMVFILTLSATRRDHDLTYTSFQTF